jgi:type IV secretory pathway TraG/TraD family ATPase VirD4
VRKAGGRCVLGFQSIAQISSIYGAGEARTIVENCSNTLILRCSASEGGGTAEFASHLIGQREIIRETVSTSDSSDSSGSSSSTNYGQEHRIEYAVLASEIESLPDRQGYLKHASAGVWLRVGF